MKYSVVLMALLGNIAASELTHHHHHHSYYAPVSFVEAEGDGEVADEAKPKKAGKKAKKSKSKSKSKGKKAGKKGKKGSKKGGKKTYTPVKASGDNGRWTPADSRRNFEQHVSIARDVVEAQKAFEKKQTDDIKKMNDKAAADAKSLRNKVGAARNRQMAGDYPQHPFPTLKQWASPPQTLVDLSAGAWAEPEAAAPAGPKVGTPAWSYKEKADSLKEVRRVVAEQERFMAEHNAMVAANYAADDAAAKAERARVSRARQTQLQGGLDY
jgi:hypothetical protein